MVDEKKPERESEEPSDRDQPEPQEPPSETIKENRDIGDSGDRGGTRLERPKPWPDPPEKPGEEED